MQENSSPLSQVEDTPDLLSLRQLGAVLRAARKVRDLRQADLAGITRTSTAQIHRIETGRGKDMSLARFLRICQALGVAPDQILAAARGQLPAADGPKGGPE